MITIKIIETEPIIDPEIVTIIDPAMLTLMFAMNAKNRSCLVDNMLTATNRAPAAQKLRPPRRYGADPV